jgi:aryl-alcohol dehydrogenase-like predicted oxidoreductase
VVSNFAVDLLERCARIAPLDSAQLPLSLLERRIVSAELPWLREQAVPALIYSPLESGLLSGSFSLERLAALPEDDWRRRRPKFQSPTVERALALVELLRPIAAMAGASPIELAIAWTLHCDGVTGAIAGARSPAQVDGWIGAATLELSADERRTIATALAEAGLGE